MSDGSDFDDRRFGVLADLESLPDTLSDRPAGSLFGADLEEAKAMARQDPRFKTLVFGLQKGTLGERMNAVREFFDRLPTDELATMELPPNLSQLRFIHLSSQAGWPRGGGRSGGGS